MNLFWRLAPLAQIQTRSKNKFLALVSSNYIQKGSVIQIQEIVLLTQNISIPIRYLVHLILAVPVKMSYWLATFDDCDDVIESNLGCRL